MNVLYVYKDYFPVLGGIEGHIKCLAEGMRARGVDAHVLVTNTARQTISETINGVPVLKAGRLTNVSSAPVSIDLFRRIRRFQPDITHLHFPYPIGEMAQLLGGRSRWSMSRKESRWSVAAERSGLLRGPIHVNAQ